MQPELTIIVLTYNSAHIITDCLSNLNFDKYEVVVVDNNSSDDTIEVVRNNFPAAKIIESKKNIGFGRGNNIALEQTKTPFALVLNPDAIIKEKDVEIVLTKMKMDEKVAIAGPLTLENYPVSQDEIDQKKQEIEQDLVTIKDTYYRKTNCGVDTKFIVGACVFFRISSFSDGNFFDKNIFMFYEDDELSQRVRSNGYYCLTVPEAIMIHQAGSSSKKSFRTLFLRSFYLKGWSKLYWKEIRQGKLRAKRSSVKLIILSLIRSLGYLTIFNFEKSTIAFATFYGALCYFIGLKAFKKDGTGRA